MGDLRENNDKLEDELDAPSNKRLFRRMIFGHFSVLVSEKVRKKEKKYGSRTSSAKTHYPTFKSFAVLSWLSVSLIIHIM